MSEKEKDIATAIELIKEWLEEEQGSYLALENMIVHWNNDIDKVFQSTWVNLKLKDCVRVIKATRFPLGLMKYCTEDALLSAAQELDRVYERGVSTSGACPSHYFNYKASTINDPLLVVVVKLLEYCERNRWNVRWVTLTAILDEAWGMLELKAPPNRKQRNDLVREACRHTGYTAKEYSKRYNFQGKRVPCIKLDYVSGFLKVFTEEDHASLARIAIKGSQLKGHKGGMIISTSDIAMQEIDVSKF